MNLRAIVPAAGKGSRLARDGLDLPKVLHKIAGRELISFVLDEVSFIPPEDTYVVTGYKREQVVKFLKARDGRYKTVVQEPQLGTGHAVSVCGEYFRDFDGDVLVSFGDMPMFRGSVMKAMCEHHDRTGAACTLMTAENPALYDWARILRDDNGSFIAIVEGRDCTLAQLHTKELFAGVMVFDSKALFETLPYLRTNNAQHEYYLTEVPELLARSGRKVETYKTDDPDDLCGVNSPEDIGICEKVLARRAGR